MNKQQVMELIKSDSGHKKAIRSAPSKNSKNYGIGLTDLRKMARKIGRDHDLALELWSSDIYEARILALLIDDPKLISREQAEEQVENLDEPILAHVFSSCNASLAKVPFITELTTEWLESDDKMRLRCGYGLLSEMASSKKKNTPDDSFFLNYIDRIHKNFLKTGTVQGGYALLCMGKRNKKLNAAALKVAKEIARVESKGAKESETLDLVGHLTKGHLRRRLGIA